MKYKFLLNASAESFVAVDGVMDLFPCYVFMRVKRIEILNKFEMRSIKASYNLLLL